MAVSIIFRFSKKNGARPNPSGASNVPHRVDVDGPDLPCGLASAGKLAVGTHR
jgi:hypothetical protein